MWTLVRTTYHNDSIIARRILEEYNDGIEYKLLIAIHKNYLDRLHVPINIKLKNITLRPIGMIAEFENGVVVEYKLEVQEPNILLTEKDIITMESV